METAAGSGQELGAQGLPQMAVGLSTPSLASWNSCVCSQVPKASPASCSR